jgi:hypothetical protein
VKERHEQGGADDRPYDRKRLAAHPEHERLRQSELMRNPRPDESADETEDDGSDKSTSRSASESLADSAADGGYDDQYDEPGQCKRHGLNLWFSFNYKARLPAASVLLCTGRSLNKC